jgi:hypothetical protein
MTARAARVRLNVGGCSFETERATLEGGTEKGKQSFFHGLLRFHDARATEAADPIWLDRDPEVFRWVLAWLRSPSPASLRACPRLECVHSEADFLLLPLLGSDAAELLAERARVRSKQQLRVTKSLVLGTACHRAGILTSLGGMAGLAGASALALAAWLWAAHARRPALASGEDVPPEMLDSERIGDPLRYVLVPAP